MWPLKRMRPGKISRKKGALERKTMSVDNFFVKLYSTEEGRDRVVAGGDYRVKQILFFIPILVSVFRMGTVIASVNAEWDDSVVRGNLMGGAAFFWRAVLE